MKAMINVTEGPYELVSYCFENKCKKKEKKRNKTVPLNVDSAIELFLHCCTLDAYIFSHCIAMHWYHALLQCMHCCTVHACIVMQMKTNIDFTLFTILKRYIHI